MVMSIAEEAASSPSSSHTEAAATSA